MLRASNYHGALSPCNQPARGWSKLATNPLAPYCYARSPAMTYDDLSTAVPSPALTLTTPPHSPGSSLSEVQSHVPSSDVEGFALPDAERSGGSSPEFVLSGGGTLRSLLAEFMRGEKAQKGAASPVLAPAPVLPPGLEEFAKNTALSPVPVDLDLALPGAPLKMPWATCVETMPPPQWVPAPTSVALPMQEGLSKMAQAHALAAVAAKQCGKPPAPAAICAEGNAAAAPAPGPARLPAWCTTAMLRNIPNKYTRDMLIARLHEDGFKHDLDFLYMPVDFKHKCNMGYAFLNFRSPQACTRFAAEYHMADSRKKLPGFRSGKVCEVTTARCQGREENVMRLLGSPVMAQLVELDKAEWLPVVFSVHGECTPVCRPNTAQGAPLRPGQADTNNQRRNPVPHGLVSSLAES